MSRRSRSAARRRRARRPPSERRVKRTAAKRTPAKRTTAKRTAAKRTPAKRTPRQAHAREAHHRQARGEGQAAGEALEQLLTMGAEFSSPKEFRTVMDRVFSMMSEDPDMGPKLRDADVPQRFEFTDVDLVVNIRAARRRRGRQPPLGVVRRRRLGAAR